MSRRRPSRPVLPSRVPGCRWVRRRGDLRLLGAPGLVDVYPTGGRWMAVLDLSVLRWRGFRTKREAMRWAEGQVRT